MLMTLEDCKRIFKDDYSEYKSNSAKRYASIKSDPVKYAEFRKKMRSLKVNKNKKRSQLSEDSLYKQREYHRLYYSNKRKNDNDYRLKANKRSLEYYYRKRQLKEYILKDNTFGTDRNPVNWVNKKTMELYNVARF